MVCSYQRGNLEITPIGAALILLGAFFFVVRPGLLYWSAIFFVPFSSTAVVNVGSEGNFSGLQAWMFFGTLWLAHDILGMLGTWHRWYKTEMKTCVRRLLIFFLVAVFSLVMPLWINGRLWISSAMLEVDDARPLYLSLQHFTQILYLAYGILFAIFVGIRNSNMGEFRRTVRILLYSTIFVSFWGILQWFCYLEGLTYPSFIFNTNKNETAMGFSVVFSDLGIARVASVATEPSGLAQYLLVAVVFASFAVMGRQLIISKSWDIFALGITALVLLLSTSTIAYLGLVLLIPVFLVSFSLLGRLRRQHVVLLVVLLIVSGGVYARSPDLHSLADSVIFSKADTTSGLDRLNSVLLAKDYFLRYPILGVGWGTVTSHDLIFKLLADVGVVGLISFAWFIKALWSSLWRSSVGFRRKTDASQRSYWASGMLVATAIILFTNILTGFSYVFGPLWLVFGMGLAVSGGEKMRPSVGFAQARRAPA